MCWPHHNDSPSDRLPLTTAVDTDEESSVLREAFRQLARSICPAVLTHHSELRIEGTVGVTVDGGDRVVLIHFAEQVYKTDSTSYGDGPECRTSSGVEDQLEIKTDDEWHHPKQLDASGSRQLHCEVALENDECRRLQTSQSDDKLWKTTNSMEVQSEDVGISMEQAGGSSHQTVSSSRSEELDLHLSDNDPTVAGVSCGKKRTAPQRTLLRELLCAPLPPKRALPATSCSSSPLKIGEVVSCSHAPASNSVLGELLQTNNSSYLSDCHSGPVSWQSPAPISQARHSPVLAARRTVSGRRRGYSHRGTLSQTVPRGFQFHDYQPPADEQASLPAVVQNTEFSSSPHHLSVRSSELSRSCSPVSNSTTLDLPPTPEYHYSRLLHCLVEKRGNNSSTSDSMETSSLNRTIDTCSIKNEIIDPAYHSAWS